MYVRTYIHTYWYKAMNCEQTTKKTKKSTARIPSRQRTEQTNEMDTKEAQQEEASKQEGGQVKKEQREQGKSFAFHLARRLTVHRSIDVCHDSQARGVVSFSVLKSAERSVVHAILKLMQKSLNKAKFKNRFEYKIQAYCRKCGKADATWCSVLH